VSWWLVILLGFIWWTIISHFGASILLHRHYCHRQFNVPKWFEAVGLFMLMIAVVRTPIGWIASHRMHHAHSDTEEDPHSPVHVGVWRVLTTTWDIPHIPAKYSRDLYENSMLVFCHHHWIKIWVAIWIVSLIIGFKFFVAFALMPFVLAKLGFGLLNTVCHYPHPRNVPLLNFLIAGEGYHLNHHKNFRLLRLSRWDSGGWISEKFLQWGIFTPSNKAI